jgi:hypothetical protein
VSPIAYARYLSQIVQDNERRYPFIAYVDLDKEIAIRRAEQVSRLWHASIVGMSIDEFKHSLSQGSKLRKVLVNHLDADIVRRASRRRKIDAIRIEIYYTEQTIKALEKIKASSLLLLLPSHALPSARFIVEQLRKWMKSKDTDITWMAVNEVADFSVLLNDSQYDRILVSPGARNKVPAEIQRSSRLLLLQMELDPAGLETARIRAGVIV